MGGFFDFGGDSQASTTTQNQQTAAENLGAGSQLTAGYGATISVVSPTTTTTGSAGGATTSGRGSSAAGGSLALGQGASLGKNNNITISSSDPATVARALDSVDLATSNNAAVANSAIIGSQADVEEALGALEDESNNSAYVSSQAVTTGAQLANNAQALPYGGPDYAISGTGSSSSSSLTNWLVLGGAILAILTFMKSGGNNT